MLNKNNSKLILLLAVISTFLGCKDKLDFLPDQPIENYNRVYMPEAVNGPVSRSLLITDSLQMLTYAANFGGQDYPTTDIPISFNVNTAIVDSFNAANKSAYKLLPASSYTLDATGSVIPKGQLSTPLLNISLKTKGVGSMQPFLTYVLPVGIANTTVKVNEELRTTFFIVNSQPNFDDYPNFDRTKWSIIDFSSQEANGEGPNNGRAVFALDGDVNTYWHTQWQGGNPGPPHYLTVDMGQMNTIHGVSLVGRQGNGSGKPNDVDVQISVDDTTWTDAGEFNLANNQNLQKQFLVKGFNQQVRYLKVVVNSAYGGNYTQIAELNAF